MQARALFYMFAILVALASGITHAAEDRYEPVEVMILGTVHFAGGGGEFNRDHENFMSPERQSQIKEVVSRIARFHPDKIMLELDYENEDAFNETYRAYLAEEHELTVNERQQLGMRLAAKLDHDRLYAVDFSNFLDYRPALQAMEDLNQKRLMAERRQMAIEIDATFKERQELPLDELLIAENTPNPYANRWALTIAQMGNVENPQGAIQITDWWERNLAIFARTAQYSEPGDKILIIFGSGHNYLLNQFFSEAQGFKVISPLPYLKE